MKHTEQEIDSSEDVRGCSTLIDLLRLRALHYPGKTGYTFLCDGKAQEDSLTYEMLDRQARAIGGLLQSRNAWGERVLLLYSPGLEFVAAFMGCVYAGAIAVPVFPPRPNRVPVRLQAVAANARPKFALTTASIFRRAASLCCQVGGMESIEWHATDEIEAGFAELWRMPCAASDHIAYLQYTSGSTGNPKGVILTHGNLLANAARMHLKCEHSAEDRCVSWLPVFHDMGFMAGVLQPLYSAFPVISFSPASFLQQPVRWLRAISRYGATVSGAPNFAYDLCTRKISPEEKRELSLSSWTLAFNGAEPVRAETLERFVEAFSPCGFRSEAFFPCYGLAEATLMVSGGIRSKEPVVIHVDSEELERHRVVVRAPGAAGTQRLVGCGTSIADQTIRIVSAETGSIAGAGEVGEIWVAGPSVSQGYWDAPEHTHQTFRAFFEPSSNGHSTHTPFLRTGDLGFLHNGELFVTGRLKDLIILRGQNHYPQDIESTVERAHQSCRAGCGAAFAIQDGGEERLAIVQEIEHGSGQDLSALLEAIRRTVAEEHQIQPHHILLIKPLSIPKTSSGKIQRQATRSSFQDGQLKVLARWDANRERDNEIEPSIGDAKTAAELREWLLERLAAHCGLAPGEIDTARSFAWHGMDSMAAIELAYGIESRWGNRVSLAGIFERSIEDVAQALAAASLDARVQDSPLYSAGSKPSQYALTVGQQALWFLSQLAPEVPVYNVALAVRVCSRLDVARLKAAFEEILMRHRCLRSVFGKIDGELVQQVRSRVDFAFAQEDAAAWSDSELQHRLVEAANLPFDLENGPLFRAHLFALPAAEHVLLLSAHHIVTDFWSLAVVMDELGTLYTAANGRGGKLPALPVEFSDYVRWQRSMLAGPEGERLWAYWREHLAGEWTPLNLPSDRPRPMRQSFRGAQVSITFSSELSQQLRVFSQSQQVTLYMTLLAAFEVLLFRYSGQTQFLTGTSSSGRTWSELAGMVGYLVNALPIRADVSGDPPFVRLLARVKEEALSAFEHQDFPFAELVERLQPERDPSRSPLFQTMFVLQRAQRREQSGLPALAMGIPGAQLRAGELALESMPLDRGVAEFDLTLSAAEVDGQIRASLRYSMDLFEHSAAERMLSNFGALLAGIASHPGDRVSELPLLSAAEREQLLADSGCASGLPEESGCIHEVFEGQARRRPRAVALVSGEQTLTYGELDARADELARYLRRNRVGPEVRVALLLERSAEMLVAILGVLKAGGAYVPLDPDAPPKRLQYILEDAKPAIVLSSRAVKETRPWLQREPIVYVDEFQEGASGEGEPTSAASAITAGNAAYVIYTSGSTGKPKGVVVTHGNVVRLFEQTRQWFAFGEQDRWALFHSYAFDFSVWEIWGALLYGGRLVVVPYWVSRTPEAFWELLHEQQVTVLNQTPSAFRQFLEADARRGEGEQLSLRLVIFGGEELETSRMAPWIKDRRKRAELVNMYGITETTVHVTYRRLEERDIESTASVIGRPIPDLQVYVLDPHLQPVPKGVAGELYVGGAGLARGYWQRAELTAERFVPHPFAKTGGQRLYRTGDLGRYREDGELQYLGRCDQQVKIRGFRIELREIEAALEEFAAVKQAVVVGRQEGGEKKLIGYVVATDGGSVNWSALRQHLMERLPAYMVPGALVQLDAMPLTVNGKIDRDRLPEADERSAPEQRGANFAALTPEEELLGSIWADVLGREEVGREDNFFDLGGHSLLATRVISRMREAFGVELPLRALFEKAKLRELAGELESRRGSGAGRHGAIGRGERAERPALSFAQERLWFLNQLDPESAAYHVSGGIRLRGALQVEALRRSLQEIVRRHEVLRTCFPQHGGEPYQEILGAHEVELKVFEEEEWEAAEQESRRAFELARAPALRVLLVNRGREEHLLVVTTHHIVTDAWSHEIFFEELVAQYRGWVERGAAAELAELPIQYADFAAWQRRRWAADGMGEQLRYWKQRLAGLPEALELPSDRPRGAVSSLRGAVVRSRVEAPVWRAVKGLGQRQSCSAFMTLLAAFSVLLYRYSGQGEVAVGTAVSNRTRQELEGMLGLLINTLCLRVSIGGRSRFRETLEQVRQRSLEDFENRDLPFEKLVEELHPGRSLSHTPLFQVMLIVREHGLPRAQAGGLSWACEELHTGTAKFDLSVTLEQDGGGLQAWFEYNTDLYDGVTIERLGEHFGCLLRAIAADAETANGELALLGDGERAQVLGAWARGGEGGGERECLHTLFEAQAARTPGAVALAAGAQEWTYEELNRRAERVAEYLGSFGVGPEALVGVCVRRTGSLVAAVLGVLKAGGAYVPLDPAYPEERLRFLVEDSGAGWVLTDGSAGVEFSHGLDVAEAQRERGGRERRGRARPGQLAYVIYTSGSTGRPKGVAIEHQSAARLVRWAQSVYTAEELRAVLAGTSICFDLSVFELFVPLSVGGTVVLVDNALELLRPGGAGEVSLVNTVPSVMAELLRAGRLPGSVGTVNLAGEALSRELVERIYGEPGVRRVWNLYGPSEDTTYSTAAWVECGAEGKPSIGRAIEGGETYILDGDLQPLPAGVPGELYLGGEGLARGYWQRAAVTAERFIPHPFSEQPGRRLYRTGDVAKFMRDGRIEFLGRQDEQVKIRGFRIELGEIEAALRQQAEVQSAAVVVEEQAPGGPSLVAHIGCRGGAQPESAALRRHLKRTLPEYMLPAVYVFHDALPLTPSGKVDRKALSALAPAAAVAHAASDAPAALTPEEELLGSIWADVLGREEVGREDNFFDLGGHSLLATRVISRMREAFGVELPLRALFEAPTLRSFAGRIDWTHRAEREFSLPPIQRVSRDRDIPLSFAQQRLWFLHQLVTEKAALNTPIAIRLRGQLDAPALQKSINAIIERHELLRTAFSQRGSEPVQSIFTSLKVTVPVVDLTAVSDTEMDAVTAAVAADIVRQPFDLTRLPLLRVVLLKTGTAEYVLVVSIHHIIFDGWSAGILTRELAANYGAFLSGNTPELPALPVQYADFSAWQREWLKGPTLEEQLGYWTTKLGPVLSPSLQLPVQRARPGVATFRGASKSRVLSPELHRAVHAISRREGTTVFMVLLAALKTMLYRYTGQADLTVGTWIANRRRAELENMIGFCSNTLVMRTQLTPEDSFLDLLARVREVCLDAYAHQDLPFEYLVDRLKPERSLFGSPLFQIGFALQNASNPDLHLPGLISEPFEVNTGRFMFELILNMVDGPDGLTAHAYYSTDLFSESGIEILLSHYQSVLSEVTANASVPLLQVDLHGNRKAAPRISARPVYDLLEQEQFDFRF